MPSNLTDASSFDTVTGPIGSDIRNAASVRAALQTLANRTRFLYDRNTALADIAALKAIASPPDALVRLVKARGLYVFDIASVAPEALPYIVAPTVGSGRWGHIDYAAFWKTTRTIFVPPIPMGALTSIVAGTDSSPGLVMNALGVDAFVTFPEVHDGATLASVDILFLPNSGHGALPAGAPTCEIFVVDNTGSVASPSGGFQTFVLPGSVGAYEVLQTWNVPLISDNLVDRATKYFYARFGNEYGANAVTGLRLAGFKLNFTAIPDMRVA